MTTSQYENDISGKKADVYKNLQTGGYSVRSRETENYGIVISHEKTVVMNDVEFVVSENGRQDVLKEGRKNVHAVVRGVVVEQDVWGLVESGEAIPVSYNPEKYSNFVHSETEELVDAAEYIIFGEVVDESAGPEDKNIEVFAINVDYK